MDELYNAIAAIVERQRDELRINAAWVANEALQTVDPNRISIPCVYAGCAEHAKQYARSLLRKQFDPVELDPRPQHELFTGLQWRYPAAGTDPNDRFYVLRDYAAMTKEDVDYNVLRFRAASEALAKHADALETWGNRRPKKIAS